MTGAREIMSGLGVQPNSDMTGLGPHAATAIAEVEPSKSYFDMLPTRSTAIKIVLATAALAGIVLFAKYYFSADVPAAAVGCIGVCVGAGGVKKVEGESEAAKSKGVPWYSKEQFYDAWMLKNKDAIKKGEVLPLSLEAVTALRIKEVEKAAANEKAAAAAAAAEEQQQVKKGAATKQPNKENKEKKEKASAPVAAVEKPEKSKPLA